MVVMVCMVGVVRMSVMIKVMRLLLLVVFDVIWYFFIVMMFFMVSFLIIFIIGLSCVLFFMMWRKSL